MSGQHVATVGVPFHMHSCGQACRFAVPSVGNLFEHLPRHLETLQACFVSRCHAEWPSVLPRALHICQPAPFADALSDRKI